MLFKEKQEGLKPTGLISLRSKPQSYIKEEDPTQAERSETDSVMEVYEPFLSDSFMALNSDYAQSTPIKILRDTGASQSLILADTLLRRLLLGEAPVLRHKSRSKGMKHR